MRVIKKLSDFIFIAFVSFLLVFIFASYFLIKPYSFVFSICMSLLIVLLYAKIISIIKEKKDKKQIEEIKINETLNQLCFYSNTKINNLFIKCFIKKGYNIKQRKLGFYLMDQKLRVFCFFKFEGLSKTDIVLAFNSLNKDDRAVIYTPFIDEKIKDFAIRFNGKINVIYGKEVYDFLNSENMLPNIDIILSQPPKQKITIKNFFEKKRAKGYLAFGTIFIILSFFVTLKTYYVIAGGIMLLLSIFSRFFGKTEEKQKIIT